MVKDRVDHFLVAVDDLADAVGQSCFDEQLSQPHRQRRVALAWLDNEGVARGDRRAAHPQRDHSGKVEWGNPRTNADRLAHRIPVEEVQTVDGRVLVVHVPSRLPGTAWQIGGRYLKRAGDGLAALSDAELRAIFAETGPDFSAEVCAGAGMGDLSPLAIEGFRARWAGRTNDGRKTLWTDEQTLNAAELRVEGGIMSKRCILTEKGSESRYGRYEIDLAGEHLLGRGPDCDVRLPEAPQTWSVSRHHCLLTVAQQEVRVRDASGNLGSGDVVFTVKERP